MKKIISALAVSALVFGSAAAKTSVNLNYRNGAYLYGYQNNGDKDAAKSTTHTFGSLNGYNGGQDSMTFKASGDVLDFLVNIQPSIKNNAATSDQLRFNALKIGAKWGGLYVNAGWNGDGLNGGYRVTNDAANNEGMLFETAKLGSIFANSASLYADNQINITGLFNDRIMYGQADYTITADALKINIKGTAISNHGWANANDGTGKYLYNDGYKGWSVFLDVSQKDLFKAEAFIKGAKKAAGDDSVNVFVPGAYVQWLGTENLILTAGGAASIYDGNLSDYSADLRARYEVNKQLAVTYYLKYSAIDDEKFNGATAETTAKITKNVGCYGAGGTTAWSAKAVLWNFLNVKYVFNPTVTGNISFGAMTDVKNKTDAGNGTTLSIHPNAQFFAGKGASITVGVAASFQGIGSEKASSYKNAAKDDGTTQIGIAIPVLFRVTM